MDPITVAVVVTAVATGAGGELGRQAWDGLSALVRRPFRSRHAEEAAGDAPAPSSGEAELVRLTEAPHDDIRAADLATVLAVRAEDDEDFAAALTAWLAMARKAVEADGGGVRIGTNAGQVFTGGQTFTGTVTFSGAALPPPQPGSGPQV